MIDRKYIELIQQEIDGVIAERDRQKLREYLAEHPEARQLLDELRRVCEILDRTQELDPPEDLGKRVLNSIDFNRYSARRPHPLKVWLDNLAARPRFRVAYAFSGGVVLGLLISALLFGSLLKGPPLDPSEISGTMISPETAAGLQQLTELKIDLAAVKGKVTWHGSENVLRAELNFQVSGPITVVLEKPATLRFGSFQLLDGFADDFQVGPDAIRLTFSGHHRSALTFQNHTESVPQLKLSLLSSGSLLYEKVLSEITKDLDR